MPPTILCVTHSKDFYNIDLVQQAIEKLGYNSFRFNCDEFPSALQFSYSVNAVGQLHTITQGKESISTEDIAAVWLRKDSLPALDVETENGEPPAYAAQCIKESSAAKNLLFNSLKSVPWMDHPLHIHQAEDKGEQMRCAIQAGLNIPDTLITNSPEEVRAFFDKHRGNIVTKMLTPLTVSMGRPSAFVYTSRVKPEHLDKLDGLQYAPMVFQEEIPKAFELRVAYVAGRCFSGKIASVAATEKTQVDWRRADAGECHWEPYELTAEVAKKIHDMMQQLSLLFGAIDLIVTPAGECVFLEVNPNGEWGMLQKFLGLPIAEAIAEVLTTPVSGIG